MIQKNLIKDDANINIIEDVKHNKILDDNISPGNDEEEETDNGYSKKNQTADDEENMNKFKLQEMNRLHKKQQTNFRIRLTWKSKVMRFLAYCFNGGLTDYLLTYEKFILEIFNKCQNANNDIMELIFQTINMMDLNNISNFEIYSSKEMIGSLNENSNFIYNEDALAACIKSGFLARYLSETLSQFPKFLAYIIKNCSSNKILSKK